MMAAAVGSMGLTLDLGEWFGFANGFGFGSPRYGVRRPKGSERSGGCKAFYVLKRSFSSGGVWKLALLSRFRISEVA